MRRLPPPPRRAPWDRCPPRRPDPRARRSRPAPPTRRPRRHRRRRMSIRGRCPADRARWPTAVGRRRPSGPGAPWRHVTGRCPTRGRGHPRPVPGSGPPAHFAIRSASEPVASPTVRVTMMLCDAAQVSDGKLYVLGGGWSMTGPDPVPSAIALKIDVGWHEAEAAHHWELFLEDADGRPVLVDTPEGEHPVEVRGEFTVGRPPGIPEGSPIDVALAVNLGPLPLTPGTRYTWRMAIDGESQTDWVLGFTTRPTAPKE